MDNQDRDICDCQHFDEGDWVECKLNTDYLGIIVSESGFGRFYDVQLAGSLEVKTFHWATIQHAEDPDVDFPPAAQVDGGNVVHVDFTKRRPMTVDSNTEGAA